MANRYIYSGAGGAGTGADWANAFTTVVAALSGASSTDAFYVASDHVESAASAKTINFPNSTTNLPNFLSVDRAGSVPPVAADIVAGAIVTTTGANTISMSGRTYVFGVTFNCGTTGAGIVFSLSTAGSMFYESCAFNLVSAAGASSLAFGASISSVRLNNCTLSFGAAAQGLNIIGDVIWYNKPGSAAITGATLPTTLIQLGSTSTECELRGLDLSALGSGKTLVAAGVFSKVWLVNCKLDAAVTIAANPTSRGAGGTWVIGCHSSGNVARNEIYLIGGTLTTETTIIRTGGASDGTTAYSWKIVPTANNRLASPFETFERSIWNEDIGAPKTLTVHCVTDNVTLTDAEIWLEVEYLGSSGTPVTTLIHDGVVTILTTPANQASSSEAWTTTGLGTPLKQKLEVTFTPEMVGPIRYRVKYAKTSTTVYVCPKAELS